MTVLNIRYKRTGGKKVSSLGSVNQVILMLMFYKHLFYLVCNLRIILCLINYSLKSAFIVVVNF